MCSCYKSAFAYLALGFLPHLLFVDLLHEAGAMPALPGALLPLNQPNSLLSGHLDRHFLLGTVIPDIAWDITYTFSHIR